MICPHCRIEVHDEASVCVGCRAEIVHGLSSGEFKFTAGIGAFLGWFLRSKMTALPQNEGTDKLIELAIWGGGGAVVMVIFFSILCLNRVTFRRIQGPR